MTDLHDASHNVRKLVAMGRLLVTERRLIEALEFAERATDATNVPAALQSRAWRLRSSVLFLMHHYDDALAAANHVVELRPNAPTS
jgi:hypothetical protein